VSTSWNPDRELRLSEVLATPELVVTTHKNFTAWLRTSPDSPNRLAVLGDNTGLDNPVQFERFGDNDVGEILQALADHHGVTFTCYLGLERVAPGGDGIVWIADLENDDA